MKIRCVVPVLRYIQSHFKTPVHLLTYHVTQISSQASSSCRLQPGTAIILVYLSRFSRNVLTLFKSKLECSQG